MKKLVKFKTNRGMSYVELIVVLSIFSVMSSVVIFNYKEFQGKVDIKNLASDIALKVVEAQNASLSGKLPVQSFSANWKPSYGVYLDITTPTQFIYFVDLNNLNGYEGGEMLDTITITKGNYISKIESYLSSTATSITNPLAITFKRPDSKAVFYSNNSELTGFDYLQITIASLKSATATIKVYPSGRIQVN